MYLKNLNIIIFLIISAIPLKSQDAEKILREVKNKLENVNDYEVEIDVKVDMEFLRIPKVSAKVYFKKPDLMKIESDDFAVLPKEAVNFSPAKFLENNYQAIFVKKDTMDGIESDVIKIIPLDDSTNIVLSTLWINHEANVISKVETTTKRRGTFTAKLTYDEMINYGLPAKMVFQFNISDSKMQELMNMDQHNSDKKNNRRNESLSGIIVIEYSKYMVNKGLEDSFFSDN